MTKNNIEDIRSNRAEEILEQIRERNEIAKDAEKVFEQRRLDEAPERNSITVAGQAAHNAVVNLVKASVIDEMYQVLLSTLGDIDEPIMADSLEQLVYEIEERIELRLTIPKKMLY